MRRFVIALMLVGWMMQPWAVESQEKSNWYIGFGIGGGDLKIEGKRLDDELGDVPGLDIGTEVMINLGVGMILNPKIHLGLDVSSIGQTVKSDMVRSELDLQVTNIFGAATYYPMDKGLSIKGGLGPSVLRAKTVFPGGLEKSEDYNGFGMLLGLGYEFWLGKSFNLGGRLEYSKQYYNGDQAPDDTEFIALYLSFYWF
jgi:hypothetical protein